MTKVKIRWISAPRLVLISDLKELARLARWRKSNQEYFGGDKPIVRFECRSCGRTSWHPRRVVERYAEAVCEYCGHKTGDVFIIPDISCSWSNRGYLASVCLN